MANDIVMPQLGLTMTEGTVVKWLKREGDQIAKGEPIFEVETDKVVQEVPALEDGVLARIVVPEGRQVPVGTVIAIVGGQRIGDEAQGTGNGEQGTGSGEKREARSERDGEKGTGNREQGTGGFVRSSPAARRLAEKLGVNIATVRGTGPSGRVVEEDVRRAAESASAKTPAPEPLVASPQSPVATSHSVLSPQSSVLPRRVPLTGIRKVVAERMAHSFSTAPHFYLTVEVDAGPLAALRGQIAPAMQRRHGVEPTVTDLLIKAVSVALREHPEANAAWAGDAIEHGGGVNLGVAVAVDVGLVVPVIRDADRLPLAEIVGQRTALVQKARAGQLTLPELEGGSFTLSNLGMFGIDQFQAIVNPPQAAILAVGRIKDRPAVVAGQVVARPAMFVTLSSDHRILDGAMAARFLTRVVELIEKPGELLLE